MTEPIIETRSTPGVVIFVAVLNFITSFFLFIASAVCVAVLLFGNILGVYEAVTKQITQVYGQPNLSFGLNFIFGAILTLTLAFAVFYLLIGIGLLKGKKLAWYFQIALSMLGLLGFPLGTAISVVVLIFFFQQNIRAFFKA